MRATAEVFVETLCRRFGYTIDDAHSHQAITDDQGVLNSGLQLLVHFRTYDEAVDDDIHVTDQFGIQPFVDLICQVGQLSIDADASTPLLTNVCEQDIKFLIVVRKDGSEQLNRGALGQGQQ